MPIEFRCPQCDKLLRTPDGTAGRQAKCPQCGALATIPQSSTAAATASPLAGMSETAPPAAPNPFQSPTVDQTRAVPEVDIRRGFQPTRIDLGDVMGRAWRIYRANFGICLGATLLVLAINYAFAIIFALATRDLSVEAQQGLSILANLVSQVLGVWLFLGLMIYLLKVARGEPAMFSEIFSGGPYLLRGVGINILFALAIVVGLILLIVPGFIALTMFGPSFLVLVDQQTGVLDSMRLSRVATYGNKLTLFALYMLSMVIALGGLLMCIVGIFFVQPYIMLLYVVSYLCMTGQSTVGDRVQGA